MIGFAGALIGALALSGCTKPAASGVITEGLTKQPIDGLRIVATATEQAPATCSTLETTTGADGSFRFDGMCPGVPYALKLDDQELWMPDGGTLPADGGDGITLVAWRAPRGEGIFRLRDGKLAVIKSTSDIMTETISADPEAQIQYPGALPKPVVDIGAEDHMLWVGESWLDQGQVVPLVPSEPRKFTRPDGRVVSIDKPWWFIGVRFTSDTQREPVTVEIDSAKTTEVRRDGRAVRWIRGDAVPPGRYVVHKQGDRRTTVVVFGPAETQE